MSDAVLEEGDRLMRRLNDNQRVREARQRNLVSISLTTETSKAGHARVQTRKISRTQARELGFDV